ncbi:hypothetical protein [Halorussus aquaticus]|uniref:Uncharacterized protein n=1 Tax=Halorussus aquaticus TaxID=2953748 RepID=A0ABD5PY04_9EURY|nr:hypothetical protein [Halorussus aquaticus]
MAERTRTMSGVELDGVRTNLRLLALTLFTGSVAGMGAFMSVKHTLMPLGVSQTWAYVVMALGGAYNHLLARDLTESITLALGSFLVGLAFHVAVWIAPLWLLPYPPLARDVLLPKMLGQAIAGAIFTYLMTFFGAYFATVLVGGYLEG